MASGFGPCFELRIWGLRFRGVYGQGFRVQGLGFRFRCVGSGA